MCNHIWKKVNDVRVCVRCGLTVNRLTGELIFDRRLADVGNRKKGSK